MTKEREGLGEREMGKEIWGGREGDSESVGRAGEMRRGIEPHTCV